MTSHHQFSSSLSIIIIIFFLFLVDVQISLADDEEINMERFNSCRTLTFNCSDQRGIGYPFSGNGRPDYCGPPGYKLDCANNLTQIKIDSTNYRVLGFGTGENKTMKVANMDFLDDDPCPSNFSNATNLNSNLFSPQGVSTLNIFYGCPDLDPIPGVNPFKFKCQRNNTGSTRNDAYLVPPSLPIQMFSSCETNVQVLMMQSGLDRLTTTENIVSVLSEGIDLGYGSATANFTFCDGCFGSGGQCGFNSTLNQHICFCRNGTSNSQTFCPATPTTRASSISLPDADVALPLHLDQL